LEINPDLLFLALYVCSTPYSPGTCVAIPVYLVQDLHLVEETWLGEEIGLLQGSLV
jgi:hypothetical protein